MKKMLGIVLLATGLAGVGLGFAYPASSGASARCETERREAVDLLAQATAAGEGTAQSQALVAKAKEKSDWADGDCVQADSIRNQGYLISGAGLLVLVIGLVLTMKAKKATV